MTKTELINKLVVVFKYDRDGLLFCSNVQLKKLATIENILDKIEF